MSPTTSQQYVDLRAQRDQNVTLLLTEGVQRCAPFLIILVLPRKDSIYRQMILKLCYNSAF